MANEANETTLHPELPRYIRFFFDLLRRPAPGGAGLTLTALRAKPRFTVTAGVYTRNRGNRQFPCFGAQVTPRYVLRTGNRGVTLGGSDDNITVSLDGVSLAQGQFLERDFYYLPERADAVRDDAATLGRLFNTDPHGNAWAAAIGAVAAPREVFRKRLIELTQADVPPNSPGEGDLGGLVSLLAHYATYDSSGAYYPKWADGAAPGAFPAATPAPYREKARREELLSADEFYCYAVVPSNFGGSGAEMPLREFLVRFERAGSGDDLTMREVFSYPRGASDTQVRHEFNFFWAYDGVGVRIPVGARAALMPRLATFLAELPEQNVDAYCDASGLLFQGTGAQRRIRLFGTVTEGATLANLPEGVTAERISDPGPNQPTVVAPIDEGDEEIAPLPERQRWFLAPVDREKIMAIAARPDVERLADVRTKALHTNLALPAATAANPQALNQPGLLTSLAVPLTDGGRGVMVGVLDTGIDGSHPAFAGRIYKVWDQFAAPQPAPKDADNQAIPYGRVWNTQADITAHAFDSYGHGTHVAGIAAGAPGPAASGYTQPGAAPKATICVVRAANQPGNGFADDNIVQGVRWIFNQAATAGPGGTRMPCVVNLSLGGHGHGHDGTDSLSLNLRSLVMTRAGHFIQGRCIVASTGNARKQRIHSHIPTIAPGATAELELFVRPPPAGVSGSLLALFYARPIPANVRGCTVDVQVERFAGAGASGWATNSPGHSVQTLTIGNTTVRITNGPPMPFTQHRHPEVLLSSPTGVAIVPGVWKVRFRNTSAVPIEVHGYAPQAAGFAAPFFFRNPTETTFIGSPGCANGIICVGATVNRASFNSNAGVQQNQQFVLDAQNLNVVNQITEVVGNVTEFSCPGPIRGSSRTIRAMAPGGMIMSALSSQAVPPRAPGSPPGTPDGLRHPSLIVAGTNNTTLCISGTSMAAPFITGLIACLFEKRPNMTFIEVRDRLRLSSTMPTGGSADDWGPGRLDAGRLRTVL